LKLGSIDSDLLPVSLVEELSKLQDEVAPIDFEEIKRVVEESLEEKLEDVFSIFDREPLAAASLSQVHRAVLRKEGSGVSVKVQRPGIREKIETDLDVLESVAARLHDRLEELQVYDFPELVRIIRKTLIKEIEFREEARHTVIAVIYRLDTIRDFNKIAVMKAGKIVEMGTYNELIEKRAVLCGLVNR